MEVLEKIFEIFFSVKAVLNFQLGTRAGTLELFTMVISSSVQ
jgi:hypothetical protein